MNKLTDENVHLTDLWTFTGMARDTATTLRAIHSHDGGIRSAAYGVRAANGLEALRLVAWFATGPVLIGTTEPSVDDGRVVHGLDIEATEFAEGVLADLALEILAVHCRGGE